MMRCTAGLSTFRVSWPASTSAGWVLFGVVLVFLTVPQNAVAAADAKQENACLIITPYVMDVTSTTATVRWSTNLSTSSRLCYRPVGSPGGAPWSTAVSQPSNSTARLHSMSVTGLTSDTTFEYKVLTTDLQGSSSCEVDASLAQCRGGRRSLGAASLGSVDVRRPAVLESVRALYRPNFPSDMESGCSSLTMEFTTSPSPGKCGRRFRSWWLGDAGQRSTGQMENFIAALAFMRGGSTAGETSDWDATFALGDNAYASGTEAEYRRNFFSLYCRPLARVGLYPTMGNHDAYKSNSKAMTGPYFDLFVPGHPVARSHGSSYSYHHGRVHVVMLDINYRRSANDHDLFKWLDKDLSEARQGGETDWIIVANHYPAHSRGGHNSDKDRMNRMRPIKSRLLTIFEKHGVDVNIAGHSHNYERSHLLLGHHGRSDTFNASAHVVQAGTGPGSVFHKPRCGGTGMVHVVTGSASLAESGRLNHPAHDVSSEAYCTVVMHVEGTHLQATCVGPFGQIVDSFTIVKDMDPDGGCPKDTAYGPPCESYATPASA